MLSKFLEFNKNCPVCGNPLTLYMQWVKSLLFKGEMTEPNVYDFRPVAGLDQDKATDDCWMDNMLLADRGDHLETAFSSNKLQNEAKKYQIYFFYLCNPEGIKKKPQNKFEINLYTGCYYRSTPFFEFQRNDQQFPEEAKAWTLEFSNPETKDVLHRSERFCISNQINDVEKVYMVSLNHYLQETIFWYYAVSDEQKKEQFFKPKVLEKRLPLLKNRPDFADRDKLIDRMDGWVIMS